MIEAKLKRGERTFSLEIFPPKDRSGLVNFLYEIDSLFPDWVSVTCGASGTVVNGPSFDVLDLAREVFSVPVVAHLTCNDQKSTAIEGAGVRGNLEKLEEIGIFNILALRGDRPQGSPVDKSSATKGAFEHATDLIQLIKGYSDKFLVGVAAYPEGHPESGLFDFHFDHLKEKQDCGADYFVTQMFFDNDVFYRWLSRARSRGITIPIVAGVMPVFDANRVAKMCSLSNASLPDKLKNIIAKFGQGESSMFSAGIAYTCAQIVDLYANGVNHIHLYTMNRYNVAAKIYESLDHVIYPAVQG